MRCLSFALANKPNANEMYMQRKEFYIYYTLCFYQNLVFWGSYLNALYVFLKIVRTFLVIDTV